MAASYQILDSPVGPLDQLTDDEAGLRIQISRTGAEVVSLARQSAPGVWEGFLWRDGVVTKPSSGWANHATVMGYYAHRLWEQQSLYRGKLIRGGTHGFLRHYDFAAPQYDVREQSLTYCLESDQIPPEAYPLRVSLRLVYRLSEGRLIVRFCFTNEEAAQSAQISFGWHPGFAVSSLETAKLFLPEGTYVHYLAPGDFLSGQRETIRFGGGEMPFPLAGLPGSFLLDLAGVTNRHFLLEDAILGHRVELNYQQAPFLTLWSNGDSFLCVEPCWGLPDANPPTSFENKPGIQTISPSGHLDVEVIVTPSILSSRLRGCEDKGD